MIGIRFHGRGGQGAKLANRILGRGGLLSGLEVQDFAVFGAERRGAPVVSFEPQRDEETIAHIQATVDRYWEIAEKGSGNERQIDVT